MTVWDGKKVLSQKNVEVKLCQPPNTGFLCVGKQVRHTIYEVCSEVIWTWAAVSANNKL
jgi:hypothetical protein